MWSVYYMAILILGFITGVCMETCPEAEDLYPCECNKRHFDIINVYCSNFETSQLQRALSSLRGKKSIELYLENSTTNISWKSFSGIGIQRLQFQSCRVDSLTNDDQPGLLDIEELVFYKSSTIPSELHLGHLKKLRKIILQDNNITELEDEWLSNGPSSFEVLQMWNNNITKIGNNIFSRLNNLKTLYIEGNRLGSIKRSMLPTTADRLEELNLRNNGLTDLPVDLFIRMPIIKHIYLEKNGIITLEQRTWSPIWHHLRILCLDDNNIVCDDRLNWIIKSIKKPKFYGKCSASKELEGMSLEAFFHSRSL